MSYAVNGSSMIGPTGVLWVPVQNIIDLNNQPVYSGYRIELQFGATCATDARRWLESVSSGPVDITLPGRWESTSFITVSNVYCDISETPQLVDVHMEPFSIIIHGVYL
jgi:hypothetical protein